MGVDNRIFKISHNALIVAIPLLLMLAVILLSRSVFFLNHPEALSKGIIIDLAFTIPFLYFILIKNRTIPNFTAVTLFLAGIAIATFIIPTDQQQLLDWIKTWIFPIVELTVLGIVVLKVRKTVLLYKAATGTKPDFFTALKSATAQVLPSPVNTFLATEIAVFYYAFFNWSKKKLEQHEFSYHKNSGAIPVLATIILLVVVEVFVFHVVIQRWSELVAWIISGISVYSGLQIVGLIRSMYQRPISIKESDNTLELRYGIFGEASIALDQIKEVQTTSSYMDTDSETIRLSLLGDMESHNILVTLHNECILHRFYGIKKAFTTIAFYVDDPERFTDELSNFHIGKLSG
ncbi:hypothetical protein FNH22_17525 [Fulvivirga sp. M361]|uniref:hypothetical protein n=1 Tax=Fulvivirga sp. M361 TaxID=2594266 RepID=UPI00117BCB6D|nr:hypothetical protein [Fulvivirga sp. M361]TRX55964.1 hypothetical protein FNH22_17525 [Fulvivirga sp. M361]